MKNREDMYDKFGTVAGVLRLTITEAKTGWVKEYFRFDNLILNQFRIQSLKALGNETGPIANYKIDRMKLGTGNTAAAVTDLDIETHTVPETSVSVASAVAATTYGTTYTAVLGAAEGNGNAYREIGLFMANNYMMSRRVFAVKTKEADDIWTFNWTITFTPPA